MCISSFSRKYYILYKDTKKICFIEIKIKYKDIKNETGGHNMEGVDSNIIVC